jgi:hypothetical protein
MLQWAWCGFHKKRQDTLRQTCVYTSGWIYVLRSAFWSSGGLVWILQKAYRDTLCRPFVLHPVGSAGHIVHSRASEPRNIDALFFIIRWTWCDFHKKYGMTLYFKLMFLHPVGSAHHVVHSCASVREKSMHYFSCSGGTGTDLTKSALEHVTLNLCFCM